MTDCVYTSGDVDESRIKHLRELIQQAKQLKESAQLLLDELTEQLQRSVSTSDDRGAPRADRRRTDRE